MVKNKNNESDILDNTSQCCREIQVPTQEEVAALDAMREIKKRARLLKDRMQGLELASGEKIALKEEIDRLKADWNRWEEKRKAEAKRRMILLGHEDPDPLDAP